MDVGEKEPHRPALGNLEGLVEILARARKIAARGAPQRAGEEAAREFVLLSGAAQEVDGLVDVRGRRRFAAQDRGEQRGAGEGEMVEADVEEPVLRRDPRERLRRALGYCAAGVRRRF